MFSAIMNKPYCKLAPHAIGVAFAYLYQKILIYRRETIVDRKEKHPYIHFMHKYSFFSYACMIVGVFFVFFDLLCSYPAQVHPAKW